MTRSLGSMAILAVFAAACSSSTTNDTDPSLGLTVPAIEVVASSPVATEPVDPRGLERAIPLTGPLVAGTDEGGGIYDVNGTGSIPAVGVTEFTGALPDGVEAVTPLLEIELVEQIEDDLEIRLPARRPPAQGEIPWGIHVDDLGQITVLPALWDSTSSEFVIRTSEFSGVFGAFFDGVTGVFIGGVDVAGGLIDFASDWTTGRTDPPGCNSNPPLWMTSEKQANTVHLCTQSEENFSQAEVVLKSNRRWSQLVLVPGDPTTIESDSNLLPFILDEVIPSNAVLLLGGETMSIQYDQPDFDKTMAIWLDLPIWLAVVNVLLQLLGAAAESAVSALAAAAWQCSVGYVDVSLSELDVTPEAPDIRGILEPAVECVLSLVSDIGLLVDTLEGAGASLTSSQIQDLSSAVVIVQNSLVAIKGVTIASTVWDLYHDTQDPGLIAVSLEGRNGPAPASTQLDSAVLVGKWTGVVEGSFRALLDLSLAEGGVLTGTLTHPELPCYGDMSVRRETATAIEFNTVFTQHSSCIPGGTHRLTPLDAQTMFYEWLAPDSNRIDAGVLRRAGDLRPTQLRTSTGETLLISEFLAREQRVAVADAVRVGSLDLDQYCRETRGGEALLTSSGSGIDAAFNNWACDPGGLIDLDQACTHEHGIGTQARVTDRNNAFQWNCYRVT